MTRDALPAVARGEADDAPGLDDTDRAVLAFAGRVAEDATSVTQADLDGLRAAGLGEADVVDVVLAAAARCFSSTVLDALCVPADASFAERLGDDPESLKALTVGRAPEGA